jgi:hypothetical protein
MDFFGKTITLTHNGTEDFKTSLGASVSILFIIILSWYGTQEFSRFMQHTVDDMSTSTRYIEPNEEFTIFESGFNLGFGFDDPLPPAIGRVRAQSVL